MKKFVVFAILILMLIVSEYLLLSELLAQKRYYILLPGLLLTVFCIYAIKKAFKKYVLQGKHTEAHS